MDATTQPLVARSLRLRGRACAVALALGLIAACGGDTSSPTADEGSGYAPSAPAATQETATEDATTEESTTEESTTEESTQGAAERDDDGDEEDTELVIVIEEFAYEVPGPVPPGAQLTVRNEDGVGHTVTSDDGAEFDTVVGPGEEVTFTAPDEPGDYPFHCTPHPNMTSTLVVEG